MVAAKASAPNTDLVEIKGFRSSDGYFKKKKFLSTTQIYKSLGSRNPINKSGEKMKKTIHFRKSDLFLRFPVKFPVSGLLHTTTLTPMGKILKSQSFKGRNPHTAPTEYKLREEFLDLSFWSAEVSPVLIEEAREAVYTYVQGKLPGQAEEYRRQITQQFANSPAFNKSASRYGNFTFSLPFSDLLSHYKSQFCDGKEEPKLSILGTDMYKQEIVHYVVVHSPGEPCFKDYPRVPRLRTTRKSLPFVYWKEDTLFWRPQSTSGTLKVSIKKGEIIKCDRRVVDGQQYDEDLCMWNLLTVAFHVPDGRGLEIPVQQMVDHLSAWDTLEPYMKKESTKQSKSGAEALIAQEKRQYGANPSRQ